MSNNARIGRNSEGIEAAAAALARMAGPAEIENAASVTGSLTEADFGFANTTGSQVNTSNARKVEIVFSAINLLASSLSTLPMSVMDISKGRSAIASDHWAHYAVHSEPTPGWGPARFFDPFYVNALLFGNAAAWRNRDHRNYVLLPWHRIRYEVVAGQEWYNLPGGQRLPGSEVVHLRAPSLCGNGGDSPVALCAKALGISMNAEQFAEQFYSRAVGMSGHVEADKDIEWAAEDRAKFIKSFREQFSGPQNAGKTGILPPGAKYIHSAAIMRDAQHVEQQLHQTRVVARIFNIPPHKLGDNAKTSYSSIEQEQIRYVTDSLRPWIVRTEQEFGIKSLTPSERLRGLRFMVNADALLRGDAKTRTEVLTAEVAGGLRTVNEGRGLIDLDPVEGGDQILVPANNLAPLALVAAGKPTAEPAKTSPAADSFAPLFADACERMLKIERNELSRRVDSASPEWVDAFYESHADRVRDAHGHICGWVADQMGLDVDAVMDAVAGVTSRGAALAAVRGDGVGDLLDQWGGRADRDVARIIKSINKLARGNTDGK